MEMTEHYPTVRITRVLDALGLVRSRWYYAAVPASERKRPGPLPKPIPQSIVELIKQTSESYPWYGYQKIAVICRRQVHAVKDRQAYQVMQAYDLLHKRTVTQAALHQALKLYELLPQGPNELWQMDVTYVDIAGYGWWYAITVIDYYSRYLLACSLKSSYCAFEVVAALECARSEAERVCGPLTKRPFLVTDNGPSFLAKRFHKHVHGVYAHVRIQYRTPTQLGLLERFHRTFKEEEVYWRFYDNPQHARECFGEFRERYNMIRPHWALIPEEAGDPLTPYDVYVAGRAVRIPKWQGWAKGAKAKLDQLLAEEAA